MVIRQGDLAEKFYIITSGLAEVVLAHPTGQEVVVARLGAGQYFGEMALIRGGRRTATVRAAVTSELEVMALGGEAFAGLLAQSAPTRESIDDAIRRRLAELSTLDQSGSS